MSDAALWSNHNDRARRNNFSFPEKEDHLLIKWILPASSRRPTVSFHFHHGLWSLKPSRTQPNYCKHVRVLSRFRIERKDGLKIAKNSKLFYTKYGEFTSNHCGSVRGTLWRIVSKYILFLRMFQTFYLRFYQNTTNHVMGSRADHDKSRYEAYSVRLSKQSRMPNEQCYTLYTLD